MSYKVSVLERVWPGGQFGGRLVGCNRSNHKKMVGKCGMTDEISTSSQESSTLGRKCDSGILPDGLEQWI